MTNLKGTNSTRYSASVVTMMHCQSILSLSTAHPRESNGAKQKKAKRARQKAREQVRERSILFICPNSDKCGVKDCKHSKPHHANPVTCSQFCVHAGDTRITCVKVQPKEV